MSMINIINKIIITTIIIVITSTSVIANETDDLFRLGDKLINREKYSQSAVAFLEIANLINKKNEKDNPQKKNNKKSRKPIKIPNIKYLSNKRIAGFSAILSAIYFEKDNDKLAHEGWKQAINYFYQGNSSWIEEKRKLSKSLVKKEDYYQLNYLVLKSLFDKFNFLEYEKPNFNLQKKWQEIAKTNLPPKNKKSFISEYKERYLFLEIANKTKLNISIDKIVENHYNPKPKKVIEKTKTIPKKSNNIKKKLVKKAITNNKKKIIKKKITKNKFVLSKEDLLIAKKAWQYFEKNKQSTGLYNSVNAYSYTTMWDIASSLGAIISAYELKIISKTDFQKRIKTLLNSLNKMKLYNNELPNREYSTKSLVMTGLNTKISKKGSGWSALDIGRLLIWLKIIDNNYPEFDSEIKKIIKKYKLKRATLNKELNGSFSKVKSEKLRQEGRLGYEHYASEGYKLWGLDISKAQDFAQTKSTKIYGKKLLYDYRNLSHLNSEPFILYQLEISNKNKTINWLTNTIYDLQKIRYQKTKKITAFSEDSLDKKPWFAYNNIYYQKKNWITISSTGKILKNLSTFSTKAGFAWSYLKNDSYTKLLKNKAKQTKSKSSGYFAGIYEHNKKINYSLNINTNSIILETILYKKNKNKPLIKLEKVN